MKGILMYLILLAVFQGYTQDVKHFQHVLFYRWTENIDLQKQTEFLRLFEGLPQKINGLEEVRVSKVLQSKGAFDIRIALHFTSNSVLKTYQSHQDHTRIVQLADVLISDYAYFQFER